MTEDNDNAMAEANALPKVQRHVHKTILPLELRLIQNTQENLRPLPLGESSENEFGTCSIWSNGRKQLDRTVGLLLLHGIAMLPLPWSMDNLSSWSWKLQKLTIRAKQGRLVVFCDRAMHN